MVKAGCETKWVATQAAALPPMDGGDPDGNGSPPAPTQVNPLRGRGRKGGGQAQTEPEDCGGGLIAALLARCAAAQ